MFEAFTNLSHVDPDENHFDLFSNNPTCPYITIREYNAHSIHQNQCTTFYNFNIRSFNSNSDSFFSSFENDNKMPEVFVLTETWFTEDNGGAELLGYKGYHTIRCNGRRSGGVSIYIKDTLKSKLIPSLCFSNSSIELCTAEIVAESGESIFVLGIYRPHGNIDIFTENLGVVLDNPLFRNKQLILLGDLNVNILNDSTESNLFLNLMQSYYFLPIIDKPTRFRSGNSSTDTLLDQIWINRLPASYDCGIVYSDVTDHCPTFFSLPYNFASPPELIRISFRLVDDDRKSLFFEKLSNVDWNSVSGSEDVDISVERFIEKLNGIYCETFPLKHKTLSRRHIMNPWMNKNILKLVNLKSEYCLMMKLEMASAAENNALRNRVNSIIRRTKINYYRNKFNNFKSNLRKTWSAINKILYPNRTKSLIEKLNVNGVDVVDHGDISNTFNDFFSNIALELVRNLPSHDLAPSSLIPRSNNSLFLNPVTNEECYKIIQNLKNTKTDLNELPIKLFKLCSPLILDPIVRLINSSFSRGVFPECLKKAIIIPIHKKESKCSVGNYRPISILPYFSKIFERCLYRRLLQFFSRYNLLSPCQFGFRKNLSTADALLSFTEFQYDVLDAEEFSVNVLVDFTKAFDTVNHQILLNKLDRYGVRGLPLALLKSYLSNRTQLVKVGHHCSSVRTLSVGVPQGSVLGPLLYLVYVNDLAQYIHSDRSVLFADDTTFCFRNTSLNSAISHCNNELEKFYNWTLANKLTVNLDKTSYMIISNRNFPQYINPVIMNNVEIQRTHVHKFLGVTIDSKLKFDHHIKEISRKISKSAGIMYKLCNYLPTPILKNIYFSFVHSYLMYSNLVWGGTFNCHLEPLFRQQKRCIRIVNKVGRLDHTMPLFHSNKILRLDDIHRFSISCYVFKNLDNFPINSNPYSTRNSENLRSRFQRLTISQRSIYCSGPNTWNELDAELKNVTEYHLFKSKLKLKLISTYDQLSN